MSSASQASTSDLILCFFLATLIKVHQGLPEVIQKQTQRVAEPYTEVTMSTKRPHPSSEASNPTKKHKPNRTSDSTPKTGKKERTKLPYSQRPGFKIGPAHLPEGQYKRRIQHIKQDLISKAKARKEYAKVKRVGDGGMRSLNEERQVGGDNEGDVEEVHRGNDVAQQGSEDGAAGEHGADSRQGERKREDRTTSGANVYSDPRLRDLQDIIEKPKRRKTQPPPNAMTPSDPTPEAPPPTEPVPSPAPQPRDGHSDQSNIHPDRRLKVTRYHGAIQAAERRKAEIEAKRAQRAENERQREEKLARRDRERKLMDRAKRPGADGRPKLGRESKVLLERVRRAVG